MIRWCLQLQLTLLYMSQAFPRPRPPLSPPSCDAGAAAAQYPSALSRVSTCVRCSFLSSALLTSLLKLYYASRGTRHVRKARQSSPSPFPPALTPVSRRLRTPSDACTPLFFHPLLTFFQHSLLVATASSLHPHSLPARRCRHATSTVDRRLPLPRRCQRCVERRTSW